MLVHKNTNIPDVKFEDTQPEGSLINTRNIFTLSTIYNKYFPETKGQNGEVDNYNKYWKFHSFHKDDRQLYDHNSYVKYLDKNILLKAYWSKDTFLETIKILTQEYKIHLMPKKEFVPQVVESLLKSIKEKPQLREVLSQMKVSLMEDNVQDGEVLPVIVIYPKLGKKNAQESLDWINKIFKDNADALGQGITPRFSLRVNDLVYYAQGGGDFKTEYKKTAEIIGIDINDGGIFEPDFVHFKGKHHLRTRSILNDFWSRLRRE